MVSIKVLVHRIHEKKQKGETKEGTEDGASVLLCFGSISGRVSGHVFYLLLVRFFFDVQNAEFRPRAEVGQSERKQ